MKTIKPIFALFYANFSHFLRKGTALTILTALLGSLCLFQPDRVVSAQTSLNAALPPVAAIVADPPVPFIVPSENNFVSALGAFIPGENVLSYFNTPKLPEGFENAKVPTVSEKMFSSVNSQVSKVFGFFAPNAASVPNTASVADAEPLLPQPSGSVDFDFDGDGKADFARRQSATGEWKIKGSQSGNFSTVTVGAGAAAIAPGDYDGDGMDDAAIFSAGTWTIKKSSNGQTQTISFGQAGDKPQVGDFDGDGKDDLALFRPSNSTWYIRQSSNSQTLAVAFGQAGDIPTVGNYDGDAKADVAVYRAGYWHVLGSTAGYFGLAWGIASDIPVPADYDGDGKTDFTVYRGSSGSWYVYKSSTNNGAYLAQNWGNYGDQPVPADYDGDTKADYAIWRPSTGVWHIIKSSDASYQYQTLGQTGDQAVSSAYLKQIGGAVQGYDLAKTRLSPKNATGGTDLYSRNFGWSSGLVGLSGRAGMDAGFGISYNSLVWTKHTDAANNSIVYFDADGSNISPGFRFGFPVIEPVYWDKDASRFNYLMVTPSGARVEFRQTQGASDTYETADSSYVQLKTVGAASPNEPVENFSIKVSGTDGSVMTYIWKAGAFRCAEIKDRNGNYVTINHDEQGLLRTVTDTLGRVITINYDTELFPTNVTQTWKNNNGAGANTTHTWATFSYTTKTINTNFATGITIAGPPNGTTLKVLQKITYPNGSAVDFAYNDYGQVWKIRSIAADSPAHVLNYVSTNLETPATTEPDCPRLGETRSWTENFNNGNETVVTNTLQPNIGYNVGGHTGNGTLIQVSMVNHPYDADSNTFVGSSGWMEGLPIATEDWANEGQGYQRKRWTWTNWTQDDTNAAEILNPRTIESKVGDATNVKRTTTDYYTVPMTNESVFGLVREVKVYDTNQTTVLKRLHTEYNLHSNLTAQRIIGLPSKKELYDSNDVLMSKDTFLYDEEQFDDAGLAQNISPVQHDTMNYGAALQVGRGNPTSITRHDVLGQNAPITLTLKYNTAGDVVAQTDPLNGQIKINYTDSFNDGNNTRNTFAYPTKIHDPGNNFSEVKYRFDTGENVWAKSPAPEGQTVGKITTRTFDSLGRLQKEAVIKNNVEYSYTRYDYQNPNNGVQSKVYSTVTDINNNGVGDVADEVLSETWTDGAGRVRFTRTKHPGSQGGWKATKTEYDILGRVTRSTVPTEINPVNSANPSTWTPYGDDNRGVDANNNPVWLWNSQVYDWKGRVVREINTDGTDKLTDYEGCGCAGGETATEKSEQITDAYYEYGQGSLPGRRAQKTYHDALGRPYKIDTLTWNGTLVYSSKVTKYNCRDQVEWVKEYSGAAPANALADETCPSGTCQITKMTYDGFGRLKTKKQPEFDPNTYTTWEYNTDDTVQSITDPRGATTNFLYNSRKQVTTVSSSIPNGSTIQNAPIVTFAYDEAGNRKQMTDGYGTVNYTFDSLSRITSETRTFSNLNVSHTIGYDYTLSGRIKEVNDSADVTRKINYGYNEAGILTEMSGNGYGNVTNYLQNRKVRSTGAVKQQETGNGVQMNVQYDNRQRLSQYEISKPAQSQQLAQHSYLYNETGQLKQIPGGIYEANFGYDHVGRLTNVSSPIQPEVAGAFTYSMNYDAWSNLTYKFSGYWIGAEGSYYSNLDDNYTNNRVTTAHMSDRRGLNSWVWQYDAAGNATNTGMQTHVYNSAGEKIQSVEQLTPTPPGNNGTVQLLIQQNYDGQGEIIKRYERETFTAAPLREKTTYYLRSTVLGNAVLAELNAQGQKETEFVYDGNGEPLAKRANNQVNWIYTIPQTANKFEVNSAGTVSNSTALDPLGGEYVPQPPPTGSPDWLPTNSAYNGSGNPMGGVAGGGGCLYNGFPEDCSTVARIVSVGNPLAMGYGMSQYLLQMTVARSFSPIGRRESGYSYGRRVVIDRYYNGRVRLYEGNYSTDRSLHYSVTSTIYSSNASVSWNLQRQTKEGEIIKLPDDLRERLVKRAGNDTDCGKAVQRLINKVAENTGRKKKKKTDIGSLYDKVKGKIDLDTSYQPFGAETGDKDFYVGGPKISFGPATTDIFKTNPNFKTNEDVYEGYVFVMIHELIHNSSKNGRFGDATVLEAVRDILVKDGIDAPELSDDPVTAGRRINDYYLKRYCPIKAK